MCGSEKTNKKRILKLDRAGVVPGFVSSQLCGFGVTRPGSNLQLSHVLAMSLTHGVWYTFTAA